MRHFLKSNVKITARTLIFAFLSAAIQLINGQSVPFTYFYRVYFRDKGNYTVSDFNLNELVSERAIKRRAKAGILATDYRDLPVFRGYIDSIKASGFTLHCSSKWMNTALFKTSSDVDLSKIKSFPFVSEVKVVKNLGGKGSKISKADPLAMATDLPAYDQQITMVNGYALHNSGYNGTGVLIAVLDAGFIYSDKISSLQGVRTRKGIKSTYDFVNGNEYVYNYHWHGTAVLSILGGKEEGKLEGSAPSADYVLLRTEDDNSEFPCEEDYWGAGAEYADSVGADIISSSLGYYRFDDPSMSYKITDLNGNTSFITRIADIAASKGILVVNSAGNERGNDWGKIIFPADGDSVLAIGAVDANRTIAAFSSAGPSADGRIKPNISAMGVNDVLQTSPSSMGRSSGTSFSCPVISGMSACLLEAVPKAVNYDIIKALQSSADRYNSPDSLYGYGIPDMGKALSLLQDIYFRIPENEVVAAPNPFTGSFELIFRNTSSNITVEIFTATGKIVFQKLYSGHAGRTIEINDMQRMPQGIYFIRIKSENGTSTIKVIKLSE